MAYIKFDYLCQSCGTKLLQLKCNKNCKQFSISTWYPGVCDCCGQNKIVTQSRDFGYPKQDKKSYENNNRTFSAAS